jgi:hypothetical protein
VSGRNISPALQALLQQPHVTYLLLLEMGFTSGTVRLAAAPHDVDWAGHTWLAAQGIGTIEPITETATGAKGLKFTLAAANPAAIAGFFTEPIQGRPVVLRLLVIGAGEIHEDPNVWSGTFDVPRLDDTTAPTITVTAEHEMLAWQTPSGTLFSHADQQAIDATDLFFEFAAEMDEKTLVWPSKEALS